MKYSCGATDRESFELKTGNIGNESSGTTSG